MIDEIMILPLSNDGDLKTKYEAILTIGLIFLLATVKSWPSGPVSWVVTRVGQHNFSIEMWAKKLFAFLLIKTPVDQ